MKRVLRISLTILATLFVVSIAIQRQAQAQEVFRLAANFNFFGEEKSTLEPVPGIPIYTQTVVVPAGVNVLYVTMATTGDTHGGARSQFACQTAVPPAAFTFCQPGPGNPAGEAPPGWISLQRHRNYNTDYVHLDGTLFSGDGGGGAGDLHDNSIHYTWCTPVPFQATPSTRTVVLRMASSHENVPPIDPTIPQFVFIEGLPVIVDASFISNPAQACVKDLNTAAPEVPNPNQSAQGQSRQGK